MSLAAYLRHRIDLPKSTTNETKRCLVRTKKIFKRMLKQTRKV